MKRTVLWFAWLWIPMVARAGMPPRYGGDLRVALPAVPVEVDPARAHSPSDLAVVRALHATLLEIDVSGALRPGLLTALPETELDGRAIRLRLRSDLRFHDGSPITSTDVAASLARLLAPSTQSPHGWIALAIEGSNAVLEGRASDLTGVQILSETELRIRLEAPFVDFSRLLATTPASIVPRGRPTVIGAGPFRLADHSSHTWRLVAYDGHHRGRSYLDTVLTTRMDGRRAARALSQGKLDLVLRPEPLAAGDSRELPTLTATYTLVNTARLGGQAESTFRLLGAIDRAELIRLFVGGQAVPLSALLPPSCSAEGGPALSESPSIAARAQSASSDRSPATAPSVSVAAPPHLTSVPRLVLLVPSGSEVLRAVAGRIQVKLFDRGLRVSVKIISPEELAAHLAARNFDLAITSVNLISDRPKLAALELAWALGGPTAARHALARLAGPNPFSPAMGLEEALSAVPLFLRGWRASVRAEVQGLTPVPGSGIDFGDLWLLPPRRPR